MLLSKFMVNNRPGIIVLSDPYINNVVLLMHMEGANNGTTFTDEMGHSVTAYGNAVTSTTQSKFGTAAAYFYENDGGDRLHISHSSNDSLGIGDWTVEFWAYWPTVLNMGLFQSGSYGSSESCFMVDINGANGDVRLTRVVSSAGSSVTISGCATNTWHHIAVSQSGSYLRLFVDGVSSTALSSIPALTSTFDYIIGALGDWNSPTTFGYHLTGYIDELRITKGVARYTANFTPPTSPFPNQ